MVYFEASKLGTKEYWETLYETELTNFQELGDEGEVWFGLDSVENAVEWGLEHVPPSSNPFVLDVGCGNGGILLALVEAGYKPDHLLGIDYSADAVKLASLIASKNDIKSVVFATCDFLTENPPLLPNMDRLDSWDLVVDKGTFDAISLSQRDHQGKSPADEYPQRIAGVLKPGGLFLIASCNFTEDELKTFFTTGTALLYHSHIRYPTFTFGGGSGSALSSVAFRKSL